MNLLHPWFLAAGAAVLGLPVLIHFLTRPRPVRFPLSTIRFVREAIQQKRARHRLRDWIILILRTAAVALVAFAFARPLFGVKASGASDKPGKLARVVIVDQSLSMGARSAGVTAFERARAIAATHLAYQPDVRGNLILAAAQPRATFDRLTVNFDALRDDLGKAAARSERLNLQAAINAAAELLSGAGEGVATELIVVSDFQRTNWVSVDFSPLPKDTTIKLESVAAKLTPTNAGILRVGARGRVEQGARVPIDVEIGNYSSAARQVQAELTIGGASYQLSGTIPANSKSTLTAEIQPKDLGWQIGQAKLIGTDDALPGDDSRALVLDVRRPPTYALITREPRQPRPSSSHYLERALAPNASPDASRAEQRVIRIDPQQFDRDALAAADMIVLDHPGRLSGASINLLAELMRRGRPMLYVTAEAVDASNVKLLADAAGADMKMPVELVPPSATQSRRGLFLAEMKKDQPPFANFGDRLGAAIGPLRFGGGLDSRRLQSGLADDVIASYSDRSAAIVVTTCGNGALAILNADLNASNLPSSPAFVPLIEELSGRIIGRGRMSDAVACGEPTVAYLPAEAGAAEGLSIVAPDSSTQDLGALASENGFVAWRWPAAGAPGVYQVKRGDKTVFTIATAAPAIESDLQSIDPALLTGRLAGGRSVSFRPAGADAQTRDTAWAWIIATCAMLMLAELATLRIFRT